jgi:hypothetical protein
VVDDSLSVIAADAAGHRIDLSSLVEHASWINRSSEDEVNQLRQYRRTGAGPPSNRT